MSWIGGKKALRELIVRLFPLYYERYIEVFGGGGWVLFHKPPGNDFEVYNDFNGLLVNLYRCVRDKPEELMEALRYVLNAREDFDRIRSALARDSPASDVQRAAWFYQLIRYSYASGLTSFGSQPHDMRSNFSLIEQAHRRLAKVVIENKDFEKLLHQYDRPVSFFYLDPPYHATEGYYQNIGEDGFTEADHIRLRDALMRIEGKFLLSYNDDAFVRGLYDRPGIYLMETTRINNIKQRYDNGAQFPELLIANYDLRDSAGRLNYLKDAIDILARKGVTPTARDVYAGRLAEETGVGKKAILEQMNDVLRSTQRRDRHKEQRDLAGQGNAADIRVPYSAGGDAALGAASAGRQLIAALLQSPEKIPYVRQRLNMDAVVLPEMQEALRAIFRCADEQLPVNITSLQQMLDDKPMAEVNRAQAVNAGHPLQQEDIDMYLERLDNAKPISQTVKGTTDDQFLSAFSKLRKEKGAADPPQSD